jgi:hypothetical protein
MAEKRLPREVAYWENRFSRAKAARQTFEEQWYINLAFYSGHQYAQWDKSGTVARLIEPPMPRNRVRLTINKVRPAIRREIVKLTKEEAQFYVVPNSTEPDDVAGAKVGENLVDFVLDESHFNARRRTATWWASITGTGFMKSYCPDIDMPIVYEAPSPFAIFVGNVQEETIEGQPYIFANQAVTPEKAYELYGVDLKPDTYANSSSLEQRFLSAIGVKVDTTKDLVYLKEIWIKPCRDYPTGAMLVIGGQQILYAYAQKAHETPDAPVQIEMFENNSSTLPNKLSETDYPFEHNMYPFDKITHVPSGSFYGTSIIDDLISLQKEYNRSRSQITESKNRTAKPQMAVQKGSVEVNKITSEPGLIIQYSPGFDKPDYLHNPELPSYVIQDQDRIIGDFDEITSQGKISRGQAPPGIEAASAIAYLQEENDDILYWTIASIEEMVASVGRKTLSLVQQFWTDQKMISIVSKNNSYETMIFKASDVKNNTDFRVETQSMAPRSRAAKQAYITGLMKDGLLPPEKGMRYLQLNETNRLYDELQADARHAQRENFMMKTSGQPIMVNDFDNHVTHDYEHALFMKSQEYEQLDQTVKDAILNHWREHKTRSDTQMQIQQVQGQMEGAMPPP